MKVDSTDDASVKSLHQDPEGTLEREAAPSPPNAHQEIVAGVDGLAGFRTHGPLDANTKSTVRALQERALASHLRNLAEAREKGDVRHEANLSMWVAIHQIMARMLEDDSYLTMDVGAVDKLWPRRPKGWSIVESRTITMPSGVEAMLVYCIKEDADPHLVDATETRRQLLMFLAEDAVYRFNEQPDDIRRATIAALDRFNAGGELTESESQLFRQIGGARAFGIEVDRQRFTLRVNTAR